MKNKNTGKVTLAGLDRRLDGFEGTLDGFKGTLNEFRGTLGEFRVTLDEIGETLGFVVKHMATKEDLFALQTQVNGIESDIRAMKHVRLEVRVADLEEKVFGKAR